MKHLLIFILSISVSFSALAQQQASAYFQLVTIPATGYVALDSGWKFHAGDNAAWANPSLNDMDWQPINPAKRIDELSQVQSAGIFWLRLILHVPANMQGKTMSLGIGQVGASEIYFNGKLIEKYGTVSADFSKEITFSPGMRPLYVEFTKQPVQVLAVRYSFNKRNVYSKFYSVVFESYLTTPTFNWSFAYSSLRLPVLIYFDSGIFFILCILQLFLYIYNPGQKVNLYFAFYAFWQCLNNLSSALTIFNHTASSSFYFAICLTLTGAFALIFYLVSVFQLFQQPKGLWFKLVIVCAVVPIFFFNSTPELSNGCYFIYAGIIHFSVLSTAIIATRKKLRGATIFFFSQLLVVLFLALLTLNNLFTVFGSSYSTILLIGNIFIYVIPAVCISVILSGEVAQTNRFLKRQLNEVNRLSQKSLDQEKEKQQILAEQNETLEKQVTQRTSELQHSLENLKATQAQLIQSEKMASLGELTAGIAHEIQNPLNFVNNFSEVNRELISELVEEVDKGNTEEVKAIANDIKGNEEKISHHGKRADAIVKGMLQHSKSSTGKKEPTDINKLADEYLRLAYHGLRAKDKSFNADFKTDFDESIGKINIIPQDIGRVLLNLFNNAFYTVNEKKKSAGEDYHPTVTVTTKRSSSLSLGEGRGEVEIHVTDNGNGIPQNILTKIFQPFFTTKPTGQGTGLGLSLAYDIITKEHNGTIKAESKEGGGAKFTISLPLNQTNDF